MNGGDDKGGELPERAESAAAPDAPSDGEPFEQDERPQITLDRYLSRRRLSPRMGWSQIFSMVAMLVALLLIVFYKDHCGGMVGKLMRQVAPGEQGSSAPTPPVRYRLDR